MITHIHKPAWQRVETAFVAAAAMAMLLLLLAPRSAERVVVASSIETRLSRAEPVMRDRPLPFTTTDAVQYFSTVLETSPKKRADGATVFENQQIKHPEDRWQITIWSEGKAVLVQFAVGGDYGLSLAREFFESPLFERGESEHLHGMFGRAHGAPVEKLRRFTAGMTLKEMADLQVLLLRLTPPRAG